MSTFFMFGKYSTESIKNISAERTTKANQLISDNGGSVKSGYALLGDTESDQRVEEHDDNRDQRRTADRRPLGQGQVGALAVGHRAPPESRKEPVGKAFHGRPE